MAVYTGTAGSDGSVYTGTGVNDTFVGSIGNDTITGGGGSDFLTYGGFNLNGTTYPQNPAAVTIIFGSSTLYSGTVSKGGSNGSDTFSGIRGVYGTSFGDTLVGTDLNGTNAPYAILLQGGGGNDLIDGRSNSTNQATYTPATSGITVSLQTSASGSDIFGTASDGLGGADTLKNVIRVQGSNFNDTITGSSKQDFFIGTTGNDTYNGGTEAATQSNVLRYDFFSAGTYSITVTAGDPVAGLYGGGNATVAKTAIAGGASSVDTAVNVNQFRGFDGADTFIGTTNAYAFNSYVFRGDSGNDTFNGQNNGNNRVEYVAATSAVSVDLAAGTASDGQGGTDTLINVLAVQGSSFNDTLLGGAGNDVFVVADAGLHQANGRTGVNRISYAGSNSVTIDLGTVATTDGFGGYQGTITKSAGTDTILNFANAQGGSGNDTVYGSAADNQLTGASGNNVINGRGGYDTLTYRPYNGLANPTHGAVVNLADGVNGTATNPWDGTDTLVSIEGVTGSQLADDLTGAVLASGAYSYVRGDGGNDTIRAPQLGTHVVADYLDSLSAVSVDLGVQMTSNDGWFGGVDTLVNIQATRGSAFADTMAGGTGNDTMFGAAGDDRINGKGGINVLDGGLGDDTAVFDFNLADSTIAYDSLGRVVLTTTGAINTLTSFEHYQFADTTVNEATGSFLIDDLFYYVRNKDVFAAHLDPESHYNSFGWHDGRDPNAYFSTNGYLGANQDVKAAGLNPLQHYDQFGWRDGRDPSANFDTTLYLQNNADVKAAGIDPLAHYLSFGQAEGRQAYAAIGPASSFSHGSFDAEYYLLSNPDVATAVPAGAKANDFAYNHYEAYGWHEGRNPNAFFDVKGYLNAYADVKAANIDPLGHYDTFGWKDGRDPSGAFDTKNYISHNADVAAAQIDPLLHYLQYGAYENRSNYADGTFFHV